MMEAIPHIRFPLPVTLVCVTLTETNQDTSTGVPQWDFSYGEFSDEEWESPEVPKKGQNERTSKELFLTKLSPNTWTVLDKELFCVCGSFPLSRGKRATTTPNLGVRRGGQRTGAQLSLKFPGQTGQLEKISFYLKFRHLWFLYL